MKKIFILFSLFTFHFSLSAQNWLWGKNGIGDAIVGAVKTNKKGDCYMSGEFPNDTIHFGAYTLMNSTVTNPPYSNYFDAFLVTYNSAGQLKWAKQAISHDTSKSHTDINPPTVATDDFDNSFLILNFTDSLIVDTYTVVSRHGYGSTCVIKYDSNGNAKWLRTSRNSVHDDSTDAVPSYVSCDHRGNVFLLGGAVYDTVYFGAYKLYYNHDIYWNDFLVKYDSVGNVVWAKQAFPHNKKGSSVSYCVTNDILGNAYTTGAFEDTISYAALTLIGDVNADFVIVKWDSAGNVLWARQSKSLNVNAFATGWGVTTDKNGNVYACGNYSGGDIMIGPDTLKKPTNNVDNFFVVKYDSNGSLIWVKQATILDKNSWDAWSITCDNHNNLYVSGSGGYDTSKIVFSGDTLRYHDTAKYDVASFILKLDTSGKVLCSAMIPVGDYGNSVTTDTSGKYVYFGGVAETPAIFGKDTVNPFSIPTNPIQARNFFPFVARWEACDSSLLTITPTQQPIMIGQVVVYPNPSNGKFTLQIRNEEMRTRNIVEVYNMLGEKVYMGGLAFTASQFDLSNQPSGIYLYRVIAENGSLVGEGKIIISK